MHQVYCDSYLIFDTRQTENLQLLNPKISLELNKTGSFTFTIYPSHPYYSKLRKLKSIITVYQDDYLLFRGRILNDEQGFYNEKRVTCEGELAFLVDSIQRPYDFMSGDLHTTISELFTFFINNHNSQVEADHQFKVGSITVTDPNNYIVRSDSTYLNTWESIQKKLIEGYGGYLRVRHEPDGNYIDYLADFDDIGNQKIEFGKNLLNIDRITKGEDIATAIIPLGAKLDENTDARLTIESVNNGLDYVFNQDAVDLYGWIFKTVTWDDVTIADNLLRKANEALATSVNLGVSIELNAVDLAAINKDIATFRIGTYVKVVTNPHGINSNFLVTKLSIDLANLKSNKLTLGKNFSTFTEQTNSIQSGLTQNITSISKNMESEYLTKKGAKKEYLSKSGGEINGDVGLKILTCDELQTDLIKADTVKLKPKTGNGQVSIKNVKAPTVKSDAANKEYVDSLSEKAKIVFETNNAIGTLGSATISTLSVPNQKSIYEFVSQNRSVDASLKFNIDSKVIQLICEIDEGSEIVTFSGICLNDNAMIYVYRMQISSDELEGNSIELGGYAISAQWMGV